MFAVDGIECARHIHTHLTSRYLALGLRPPFLIACTANVSEVNRRACTDAGMQHFVSKPITLDALIAALELAGKHVYDAQRS